MTNIDSYLSCVFSIQLFTSSLLSPTCEQKRDVNMLKSPLSTKAGVTNSYLLAKESYHMRAWNAMREHKRVR